MVLKVLFLSGCLCKNELCVIAKVIAANFDEYMRKGETKGYQHKAIFHTFL